MGEGLARK